VDNPLRSAQHTQKMRRLAAQSKTLNWGQAPKPPKRSAYGASISTRPVTNQDNLSNWLADSNQKTKNQGKKANNLKTAVKPYSSWFNSKKTIPTTQKQKTPPRAKTGCL